MNLKCTIMRPAVLASLLWSSYLFSAGLASEPIGLHPENPHYFSWRGKPTFLITAGEHYGAVINLDFNYTRYLDELKRHRFNLTRVFSGAYREVAGSFNIAGNTLAPAAGRFVCPWARSATPGAVDGGNKFDLSRWDETYFARLKDFVAQAGQRGVLVELVFFCTMYDDAVWNVSPMNARNNINLIGRSDRAECYSAKDRPLTDAQRALVRKLVTELNQFDNIYFELCNEPYERGGLTTEWNDLIIDTVVQTEAALPHKHLIAQGFANPAAAAAGLNRHVSVLNFHQVTPETVRLTYPLNRVVAFDETGGADRSDRRYRAQGWEFILAGGAVFDHLDFSFTPGHEDGTAPLAPRTPGGGSPALRHQLQVLKEFMEGFDFLQMRPDATTVKICRAATAAASPPPGAQEITARCLARPAHAYAIYVHGGTQAELTLALPPGRYRADWLSTKQSGPAQSLSRGRVEKSESFRHAGGDRMLVSPAYSEDIALRVMQQPTNGD